MPRCSEFTTTSASGAGGSNRAASYACIAGLPNFHYEIVCIFRMSQFRRVNLRDGLHRVEFCLLFDAQMHAHSLRQRERFKRPKCTLTEDGIDMADHDAIITSA